jgi:hypothetical protein
MASATNEAIWCIASLFINDTHYSQIGGGSLMATT